VRQRAGKYYFSYTFNFFMNGNGSNAVKRLDEVKAPAEKIYMYEEDPSTIDDGNGELWNKGGNYSSLDLLATRHDMANRHVTDAPNATSVVNANIHGNVVFCDGHADYVPRTYVHTKAHAAPDGDLFPTSGDPTMVP
jgi:hypothetical protein